MSEVIITVRGEGEARVTPERAVARISAAVDGPDRGRVVASVAALATPVRDDLAARAAAGTVAEWNSQRVSVWSDRPWNDQGRQLDLVHHASVEISATFTDFVALSDWLNEIAERDGLQVGGIRWELTPATRAATEAEVATHAVSVAVARAEAYASAIGRATVTPLEIADLGLLTDGGRQGSGSLARAEKAMMISAADAGLGGSTGFQPEDIVVTAAVEARFSAR